MQLQTAGPRFMDDQCRCGPDHWQEAWRTSSRRSARGGGMSAVAQPTAVGGGRWVGSSRGDMQSWGDTARPRADNGEGAE